MPNNQKILALGKICQGCLYRARIRAGQPAVCPQDHQPLDGHIAAEACPLGFFAAGKGLPMGSSNGSMFSQEPAKVEAEQVKPVEPVKPAAPAEPAESKKPEVKPCDCNRKRR